MVHYRQYAEDAATDQTVYVNQVIGGAGRGEQTVDFELPPTLLPAPVILAPTAGQTLTGATVTFGGTGTPGENVVLAVLPTALVNQAQALAQQMPADPEDPILVGSDGTWNVTLALDPDDYTAAAVLVEISEDGSLITVRSDVSQPIQFTLAAAPAPAPMPVVPAKPAASGSDKLAETGLELNGLGLGGALALAGAVLIVVRRKTRSN